jgi:VanZ like family
VALVLLIATLWPTPGAPQPLERLCIICGSLGGLDFVANIVVFVPLGVALVREGARRQAAGLIGFTLSFLIELLQWQVIPGRDASAGDLLSNTLGTLLGALLAAHWRTLRHPEPWSARRLLVAWSGGALLLVSAASWSLRPAAPDLVYFSQWVPERGGYAPLAGTFRGLRLFGESLPNGVAVDPTDRPAAYARGELDVEGIVDQRDTGETRPVLLARLANPLGEQAQLVQRGDALVFRGRRNASRLGLRSPTFVLDGAFSTGTSTAFRATSGHREVALTARQSVVHRITLGRFWHTLAPFEVQYSQFEPFMAAAFLAGLLLPAAFFARRATAGPPWAVPLVLTTGILGAVPATAGIAPGGWAELAGAALGSLAGAWLARPRSPK